MALENKEGHSFQIPSFSLIPRQVIVIITVADDNLGAWCSIERDLFNAHALTCADKQNASKETRAEDVHGHIKITPVVF